MSTKSMNWPQLLNSTRLGDKKAKKEPGRSSFNSDHDKVIFSGSFRRLARKTQVHPLVNNDHVHNRLTHSLEVSSVGRSLAIRVGQSLQDAKSLPENILPTDLADLVQTTCLAHDIGNPPFGHTGEEAIRNWFRNEGKERYKKLLQPEEISDLNNFEGNAQGFRVLACSEFHPYDGGLRLSYASLASFLKYPWTSAPAVAGKRPKDDKYGIYQSELELFREVADATGLIKKGKDWYCRHPLAHLMETADDFCYGLLDLEDGIEMGILKWEEVFEVLRPVLDGNKIGTLTKELEGLRPGRKPPLIRGKVISAFVEDAAASFIHNEHGFLRGQHPDLLGLCGETVRNCVHNAKKLAREKVFAHPRKIELEIGAYSTIETLMTVLCEAADAYVKQSETTFRSRRALDLLGRNTFDPRIRAKHKSGRSPHYLALMRVLDFVSGMTDNYATHLARQFSGMGEVR
ncbi:deoxyguanosinetriphosphate triphosphohydrolase [Pseudomonas sp. CGJS7]|uniref:deoxyguanosinetriphosphate triphosphohydrolase n=1 Tax=Pseudomonas sp. CGJS7 TaxID=3109348 RepID=UPI00300AAF02